MPVSIGQVTAKKRSGVAGEMPEERYQPRRRLRVLRSVGGPQQAFEQREHGVVGGFWPLAGMG
jgi:hypothetical protein